jgi:hypothetical protein
MTKDLVQGIMTKYLVRVILYTQRDFYNRMHLQLLRPVINLLRRTPAGQRMPVSGSFSRRREAPLSLFASERILMPALDISYASIAFIACLNFMARKYSTRKPTRVLHNRLLRKEFECLISTCHTHPSHLLLA